MMLLCVAKVVSCRSGFGAVVLPPACGFRCDIIIIIVRSAVIIGPSQSTSAARKPFSAPARFDEGVL